MTTPKVVCYKSDLNGLMNELSRALQHLDKEEYAAARHTIEETKKHFQRTIDHSERLFINPKG